MVRKSYLNGIGDMNVFRIVRRKRLFRYGGDDGFLLLVAFLLQCLSRYLRRRICVMDILVSRVKKTRGIPGLRPRSKSFACFRF